MPLNADLTSRIERIVKEESQNFANQIRNMTEEMRPVGTREVPEKEQLLEFEQFLQYPELYGIFLQDQKASVESAIIYAHSMYNKLGKGVPDVGPTLDDVGPPTLDAEPATALDEEVIE